MRFFSLKPLPPSWPIVLGAGLLLILAGCGVRSYPVVGEVSFPDGKPLTAGTVVFERIHADVTERKSFAVEVAPDGKFRLDAPEGEYRVMLAPAAPGVGAQSSEKVWTFSEKLGSFETSGLQFTITSDEKKNHFKVPVTLP